MEGVCTGLGDHVNHGATGSTHLRRIQAGIDFNLLQSVNRRLNDDRPDIAVVVVHAVEHEIVGSVNLSVGRNRIRLSAVVNSSSTGARVLN